MSDIAISVENLSKSYLVGHNTAQAERYTALRDVVSRNARNLARKTRDMLSGRAIVQGDEIEEFWALKEVNFEIRRGDVVGIIGRNGAGKSTLLKVLSRITEPSEGRVSIAGRVASLLEVGTGFHPELSGRENIYLNGAILGMGRAEIRQKFDEIVNFSEVEKFLDTPVKRYSSGMYVRLAFAVAAHLEPEVLIVDEVLAVGDAEFQRKCLGKMHDVANAGRTVLFVSHNLSAVRKLCKSGIYLNSGKVIEVGGIEHVISRYIDGGISKRTDSDLVSNDACELRISNKKDLIIEIGGRSTHSGRPNFTVGLVVMTLTGSHVFETGSRDHIESSTISEDGFLFEFSLPDSILRPGRYTLQAYAYLHNESWLMTKEDGPIITIDILEYDTAGDLYFQRDPGCGPIIQWKNHI